MEKYRNCNMLNSPPTSKFVGHIFILDAKQEIFISMRMYYNQSRVGVKYQVRFRAVLKMFFLFKVNPSVEADGNVMEQ